MKSIRKKEAGRLSSCQTSWGSERQSTPGVETWKMSWEVFCRKLGDRQSLALFSSYAKYFGEKKKAEYSPRKCFDWCSLRAVIQVYRTLVFLCKGVLAAGLSPLPVLYMLQEPPVTQGIAEWCVRLTDTFLRMVRRKGGFMSGFFLPTDYVLIKGRRNIG